MLVQGALVEGRRRFPESVGMLLGLSLCLHLAAVIQAPLGKPAAAATCFLMGQCALSLGLLRLLNGKWVFQDIRMIFALFFFLYGATFPMIVSWQGGSAPGLPGATFLYGTGLLGFNLVQWWHRQPWHDVRPETFSRIRPTLSNAVVIFLTFAAILGYAAAMGVEFSLSIDRTKTGRIGGQLWVVLMFVVNGMGMFMFGGWPQLSRRARIILVVSATAFVLFHISMGNRRDFLPMFIFVAAVIATRRQSVIRLGTLALGFIAFALLSILGVARQIILDPRLLAKTPVDLFLGNNEFVTPIQTIMHYVTVNRPLRLGWTYISAPSLFIPRAFWPEKPESLSIAFLLDAFGSIGVQGFAYTPVTEAFLNFGWVGPFVVISAVSLAMVYLVRNADAHPGLYFVSFAMVLDFNRGDFGGTFYSLICVGTGYVTMLFVSRLRWVPSRWRTTWPALPLPNP